MKLLTWTCTSRSIEPPLYDHAKGFYNQRSPACSMRWLRVQEVLTPMGTLNFIFFKPIKDCFFSTNWPTNLFWKCRFMIVQWHSLIDLYFLKIHALWKCTISRTVDIKWHTMSVSSSYFFSPFRRYTTVLDHAIKSRV